MLNMNRIYSILTRGETSEAVWYKRETSASYRASGRRQHEADIIRLGSADPSYWCFAAETILQAALASCMRSDLFEYDNVNTYLLDAATPGRSSSIIGLPAGADFRLDENPDNINWVRLSVLLALNADLGQASVGGVTYPYTVSGGLSSPVPIGAGTSLRLWGVTSGSHEMLISLTRPPKLDLASLKRNLDEAGAPWNPKYSSMRSSGDVGEWFGAFILDYCLTEGV